jgi:hypothetical protein
MTVHAKPLIHYLGVCVALLVTPGCMTDYKAIFDVRSIDQARCPEPLLIEIAQDTAKQLGMIPTTEINLPDILFYARTRHGPSTAVVLLLVQGADHGSYSFMVSAPNSPPSEQTTEIALALGQALTRNAPACEVIFSQRQSPGGLGP